MSTIEGYLQSIIWLHEQHIKAHQDEWAHPCYEHLVLNEGRLFDTNPRPKGVRQRKMKMCFMNALNFALKDLDRYAYVEGYANHIIATQHAWVFDRETGELIDPTWKEQETNVYYGIEFPFAYVLSCLERTGYYGILGNDYILDCELLKKGASAWNASVG